MFPIALSFAAVLSLSLSACAPMSSPGEPIPGEPGASEPEQKCDAAAARGAIGKTATADVVEQARIDAGVKRARTLKPGQVVTKEYDFNRLNLDVDGNNVITNARCG